MHKSAHAAKWNGIIIRSSALYIFKYDRFKPHSNLATPLPFKGGSSTVCFRPMVPEIKTNIWKLTIQA